MKKTYTVIVAIILLISDCNFLSAQSRAAVACVTTTAQVDLSVNNVRARLLTGGDLWWNPNDNSTGVYEVPKGSGKNSVYAGSFWIGGIDAGLQVRAAAQTYRQSSANDFWGGPISKNSVLVPEGEITQARCSQFDRFWKINRSEVESFAAGGTATADMLSWPGNGNAAGNELPFLAPFFDANNDGVYNSADGDYPNFNLSGSYPVNPNGSNSVCTNYLLGDQSIWWVFNDVGNLKTETNSDPIGIEVRAQAFAYASTNENLNNTTFYTYEIINRSSDSLKNVYTATWCDPDLGDASDDYVGCDVGNSLGYVYNGDPVDAVYGAHCPALGIMVMQGPFADLNDGNDNNFNGVTDEIGEDCRLSKFMYYVNTNGVINGNPSLTDDYYDYMSGHFLDASQLTYGGDGRGNGNGATSIPCNYMFPGNSDPAFVDPWTMATAGMPPTDMRFIMSEGNFSLAPGAVNYLTNAVIWAQDNSGGPQESLQLLQLAAPEIQSFFNSCFTVVTALNEVKNKIKAICFPNPFTEYTFVDFGNQKPEKLTVSIYAISGKLIKSYSTSVSGKLAIDGNELQQGVYIVETKNEKGEQSSFKIVRQ